MSKCDYKLFMSLSEMKGFLEVGRQQIIKCWFSKGTTLILSCYQKGGCEVENRNKKKLKSKTQSFSSFFSLDIWISLKIIKICLHKKINLSSYFISIYLFSSQFMLLSSLQSFLNTWNALIDLSKLKTSSSFLGSRVKSQSATYSENDVFSTFLIIKNLHFRFLSYSLSTNFS